MSRRIPLIAAVVAFAVAATPASGKGLVEVEVCGADGCVDRTARASHALLEGGPKRSAPRREVPYYVVRLGFGGHDEVFHRTDQLWLPGAQALRDGGRWVTPGARTRRGLERLVRGIAPLPAGSPAPVKLPDPVTGQLPPQVVSVPEAARNERDGRGPSAALVAAPLLLLGGVGLVARRRRRRRA